MGSYCDCCYLFTGLSTNNSLTQLDNHDLCEDCEYKVQDIIRSFINKHEKFNKIGHNQ